MKGLMAAFVAVAIVSLTTSAEGADDQRYTKVSAPIFDGARGKVLGSLPPASPVTVLETRKTRTKVVIEGWSAEYHDLEVFAHWNGRIPRVNLARLSDGVREVMKDKKDRWETKWHKVRITGWVDTAALTPDVARLWKAAKEIHNSRCTICHPFKSPDLLTPSQWRGTLLIMSHRAALTPEEEALVSQYLQTNARPPED